MIQITEQSAGEPIETGFCQNPENTVGFTGTGLSTHGGGLLTFVHMSIHRGRKRRRKAYFYSFSVFPHESRMRIVWPSQARTNVGGGPT